MAVYDDSGAHRANMAFIRRAMKAPLLSREDEYALARRWRDHRDEKALHHLVNAYTRLVISMAAKFRHYGLPMGDLIQEGNIGLLQAAERFDTNRDVRFSTYASWWIRAAIQDYVLRNWSIVRTGTTAAQKSLFFNLRHLRAKIEMERGQTALCDEGRREIADTLGVSLSDVTDMEQRMNGGDQSLNAPLSTDHEGEAQDFVHDERRSPEDVVIGLRDSQTRSRWLHDALRQLSPREQRIIARRRLREDATTLEELGAELGISKERVRQLEHRALLKIKQQIEHLVPDPRVLMFEEAV